MSLRVVLDTSAIRTYATGSIAGGELIGELTDEGAQFGIPVHCLIEAATGADHQAAALLGVLIEHPNAEWLPIDPGQWRQVAAAAELLGTASRAYAALPVVLGQAGYVVTTEPESYPGVDAISV